MSLRILIFICKVIIIVSAFAVAYSFGYDEGHQPIAVVTVHDPCPIPDDTTGDVRVSGDNNSVVVGKP